ncbi:GPI transamidase component PIG-T isoform X1 [Herrania umbratica]|uniref:GPI transamidase component PIG-T isoform X1 n=2 Tax=Herrania umbratica TaxID=108875 RepID=A0A6J0ZFA7_9ROSI|nr:GPI transamidase component PIG-T isoform X1 [Herrania umbratica]
MTLLQRPVLVLLLLVTHHLLQCWIAFGSVDEEGQKQEEFNEELLLKPLPDRKVLAHFHFQSSAPPSTSNGRHHHLFPKAISQLVQKFRVKEMELSFTQGRWNYERWGGFDPIASSNAKPPGVELWAVFDVPQHQVDASWKNLTHTLSGLFCASINFLESTSTYSAPEWSFPPASGNLRYGTLPREAVCTENLTPWLKLLPCRDKAGLAVLLDRPSIYRGFYHSQRLHLTSTASGSKGTDSGIILKQALTVVLQPIQPNGRRASMDHAGEKRIQPSWSLSSIFGKQVRGRCVLAKSSNVYLQLDRGLVAELKHIHKENEKSVANGLTSENFWTYPSFELSASPDRIVIEENSFHGKSSSILYNFQVEKYTESEPLDLGLTWKIPVVWSCQSAPLHSSRFLMGSGNERGAIAISLKSTQLWEGFMGAFDNNERCELQVDVFQVVPWYVKVYFHSLQVFIDQQPKAVSDVIEKIHVSPSKDKVSPGMMEMVLRLPCRVKSAALTIEFDKGFLHIDEYPPDANQGFDIPSAIISFPNFHASMFFLEDGSLNKSPLLSKFQEKSPVMSYTEVLLVPLTTPDFSMPYNVITITCTVFALYFGSLLNVLRRRVAEEERFLKDKATKKTGQLPLLLSKLSAKLRGRPWEPPHSPPSSSSFISSKLVFKVILVAGLAVGWQYYFS